MASQSQTFSWKVLHALKLEASSIIGTFLLAIAWLLSTTSVEKITTDAAKAESIIRQTDNAKDDNGILMLEAMLMDLKLKANDSIWGMDLVNNYKNRILNFSAIKHGYRIIIEDASLEDQEPIDHEYYDISERIDQINNLKALKDTLLERSNWVSERSKLFADIFLENQVQRQNKQRQLHFISIALLICGTILLTVQKVINYFREKNKNIDTNCKYIPEPPKKGESHQKYKPR